jgi:hypothetical protein
VAAVGNGQILIGACRANTAIPTAGAAYLFSGNGTLLTTLTNPAAASDDFFGYSVAAAGNDQILIGAPFAKGGIEVGEAQLFRISLASAPSLNIRLTTTNTLAVVWPSPSTGFTLQQNTNGVATANWSNVTDLIQDDGTNRTLITSPTADKLFYRLFKP